MKTRNHLYESFDFNDTEAEAKEEASSEIEYYKTYKASKEEVEAWLKGMAEDGRITGPYEVTLDGINVDGNVILSRMNLTKIPYKFNSVVIFFCDYNKLRTLEGCPDRVGKSFECKDNRLVTLKGGPSFVGGYFDCRNNDLDSLEGAPKYIGGGFYYGQSKNGKRFKVPKGTVIKGLLH